MLNVIIIDDEPKSITSLEWEITNFCEDILISEKFTQAEKAIEYLKYNLVDAVFLDIKMPKIDGFQFLDHFKQRDFAVVFVTAFSQYAIEAIKQDAIDYLLKPIDADDLMETVKKLKSYKESKLYEETSLFEELVFTKSEKRIAIPINGKYIFLQVEDIIYCKADASNTILHLENKKEVVVKKQLKEIQELLPASNFYRIHNSYIINLNKVKEYIKIDSYVVMNNKRELPVSRNKKEAFLDKF